MKKNSGIGSGTEPGSTTLQIMEGAIRQNGIKDLEWGEVANLIETERSEGSTGVQWMPKRR